MAGFGTIRHVAYSSPYCVRFRWAHGRLLKKWGEKILALPHSITVDSKDNVWIADVVLHQVFKFSHDGKLLPDLNWRMERLGTPSLAAQSIRVSSDFCCGV